jgi:uncharacterized membrane protein (UPF0127 family)
MKGGEVARLEPSIPVGPVPLAPRLRQLPIAVVKGREVRVAAGPLARLLGLAFLDREQVGAGLLIPRCRSVHTLGMRFALDLVFLDEEGVPLAVRRGVPPRRLASVPRAAAVLELPTVGLTEPLLAAKSGPKGGETLPPLA